MKFLFLLSLLITPVAHAAFIFQYGLNYSSQSDSSAEEESEGGRIFHKILLGASVNTNKTVFFGWNINSWSSSTKQGTNDEASYSMLEMGPRFIWFLNQDQNFYLSGEWNPYARGDRNMLAENREIQGSSIGFGLGYRFRITRMIGLGASIQYHALALKEEKIDTTENNVSDKVTQMMPMLELTIITK